MKKGIDVSHDNGIIEWEKVKPQIEFAMLRAGYGDNDVDESLEINASACIKLGIPVGLYWFSYAYTVEMARKEAQDCLAQAGKHRVEYPVAFDFENDSVQYAQEKGITITKELAMEMVQAFCAEIRSAGYHAAVYTNKDFSERYYDLIQLRNMGYDIWYAYYEQTAGRDDIALWQYSSDGEIAGINGRVDMDMH